MKLNGSCHKEQNREHKLSPLALAKVSAELTKGASVSKHERTKISVSRYVRMGFIKRY